MRSCTLPVLLGLATLGVNADRHRHRHAPLHARGKTATVVEVVTDIVTEYVYADGSPVSSTSTSSNTSTSSTSTSTSTTLDAIFIQLPTTSSSPSPIPSTTSSESTPSAVQIQAVPETPSTSISIETVVPAPATTPSTTQVAVVEETSNAGERIFTIINSHTAPISTQHDNTHGTPTSAGAGIVAGTMAVGAMATFAAPVGWVGNIAISDATFPITPNSTLIEANYVEWWGIPRADFDVSFVNGFTLPATCSCGGVTTTGCNLDLASQNCPLGTVNGACANPIRAVESATEATDYFKACQGAAWTYVNDGNADSNCILGSIVCCIGTACPANPKQGSL